MASLDDKPPFAMAHATWNNPRIQQCITDVESIAGYTLPLQQRAPFLHFHAFITSNPPPKYITRWRTEPKLERWYHKHVNGILGHVQNALACVWYHRDNLREIEDGVRQVFVQSGVQLSLGNSTIGLGNTIRWDAEYQAFVLAVRRCLDYLARALATYFQQDQNSFRRLPSFLATAKPETVASRIATAAERYTEKFEYVLSDGNKKSIRDLLSHYEYIGAGTLNLSRHGFLIAGGGERVQPAGGAWEGGLSAAIFKRTDDLHACIADVLTSFVTAASDENSRTGLWRDGELEMRSGEIGDGVGKVSVPPSCHCPPNQPMQLTCRSLTRAPRS